MQDVQETGTTEALLAVPPGGWTVDDLDALPETHYRHELTDRSASGGS